MERDYPTEGPIIGVTPLWDVNQESLWMLPNYLDGIKEAGGVPVVLPFDTDQGHLKRIAKSIDGFLFTGGQDVDPSVYGEKDETGRLIPCPKRDSLEISLLQEVINAGKPVFGICRGLQLINAALGGTLWQDLPSEHPSDITHRQPKPYDIPTHAVALSGSLEILFGRDELQVNSLHHQAVRDLAPGLSPLATSPDSLVEAFEMPSYTSFLLAVQWHPEYLFRKDPYSRKLFRYFVEACG